MINYVRNHSLSNDEIQRYSRQLILAEFGVHAQERLRSSSALVIGCGGLGSPAALYLASSGLGRLGLVDHDNVEISNLHRQIIHRETTVGKAKVDSAQLACSLMNSSLKIDTYNQLLTHENIMDIVRQYDVILDCTDNVITRYLINDACVLCRKPLVSASVIRFEGQLAVWNYIEKEGPCYRCLYPQAPPAETVSTCSDVGVLGPVCGTLGSLQALEAIKILTKVGDILANRMLLVDGLSMNFRTIKLRNRQSNCAVCGTNPDIVHQPAPPPVGQCTNDQPSCQRRLLKRNERITTDELAQPDQPSFIIDVRPEHELNIVKFENSYHLPMDRLLYDTNDEELRHELMSSIEGKQRIVIVCRRGNDSQIAVKRLKELLSDVKDIHEKIKDLEGGFQAWHINVDSTFPLY